MILDYPVLRDILKSYDTVVSQHLVVTEWNMNRYQKISDYGIYGGAGNAANMTYSANDTNIFDGKTFYIYDDNSTKLSNEAETFSSLASVFEPDRPDQGIILLQQSNSLLIADDIADLQIDKLNSDKPRYYPFSKNRKYDYFNSGKIIDNLNLTQDNRLKYAGQSTVDGAIQYANPFVVYEETFPCNKIVIKVQNHLCVPEKYYVDILSTNGSTWTQIYSSTSSAGFTDGTLELYYDNTSTWSTIVRRADDLDQIETPTTQLKLIKGVRLRVDKMTKITKTVNGKQRSYKGSLELIEISPRIEYDLTSYTESFNINSSISDSEYGLPVGGIVTSNGEITLSNDTKQFMLSSYASKYKLLTQDVEFRLFQKITDEDTSTTYTVPLKVMYADKWEVQEEFNTKVSLSDKMRLLQEKNVMDLVFVSQGGTNFSAIILMILDNVGVTGFEFKKSGESNDTDIKIKNFFCNNEKTVTEVLDTLAKATQSAIYMDAVGNLNVLTKERISSKVSMTQSVDNVTGGTDFWMVFDEEYSPADNEYSYVSSYKSNIIKSNDQKIDPVSNGTITFHDYGVARVSAQNLLAEAIPKKLLSDSPQTTISTSGYDYALRTLWSPGTGTDSVLGAANLVKDMNASKPKDLFSGFTVNAPDYNSAIKKFYDNAVAAAKSGSATKLESMMIYLDRNEIYTFGNQAGFIMIDNEIIEYYGILYSINGENLIMFSPEEVNEKVNSLTKRSSVTPIALVVKLRLNAVENDDDDYTYKIISDGRAAMNTDIRRHVSFNKSVTASDVDPENKFSLLIGEKKNLRKPANFKVSTFFDFKDYKRFDRIKKRLNLPKQSYRSYVGQLKIAGPKSPADDRKPLSASTDALVYESMQKINRKVNKWVPGSGSTSFDPYVYTYGQRYIYGQIFDLNFQPGIVATTMKLYSGIETDKKNINQTSTNSCIAGIGFALKYNTDPDTNERIIKSGYFVEVESAGSSYRDIEKVNKIQSLRFYKLEEKDGILAPKVLGTAAVKIAPVTNSNIQFISTDSIPLDSIFNLEIRIKTNANNVEFDVYYGRTSITNNNPIVDKDVNKTNFWDGAKNVFLFVRDDSQAMFENVIAVSKAIYTGSDNSYFNNKNEFIETINESYQQGKISQGSVSAERYILFNDQKIKMYYNDFAKLAREVKKYTPRYQSPALSARIIDISRINPQYMILDYEFSSFGAEIVVANTSTTAIAISADDNLPLYLTGTQIEELSSGNVTLKDYYAKIDDDGKKVTDLQYNKSVYGEKTFTIDSIYIQDRIQANELVKWIMDNCSRERLKFTLEIFPNPLLELGDKVKIYSKDRGYLQSNDVFGKKTFVVSEINHSINSSGPSTTISIVEVGVI